MTLFIFFIGLIPVLIIGAIFIDLIFASAPRRGKAPYANNQVAHSRLAILENHRRVAVARIHRHLHEKRQHHL